MRRLRRKEKMGKKIKRGGEREREKKKKGKKKSNGTLSAASARKFASTIYSSCPQPPMQNIDRKLTNILYGLLSKQGKKKYYMVRAKIKFFKFEGSKQNIKFQRAKV